MQGVFKQRPVVVAEETRDRGVEGRICHFAAHGQAKQQCAGYSFTHNFLIDCSHACDHSISRHYALLLNSWWVTVDHLKAAIVKKKPTLSILTNLTCGRSVAFLWQNLWSLLLFTSIELFVSVFHFSCHLCHCRVRRATGLLQFSSCLIVLLPDRLFAFIVHIYTLYATHNLLHVGSFHFHLYFVRSTRVVSLKGSFSSLSMMPKWPLTIWRNIFAPLWELTCAQCFTICIRSSGGIIQGCRSKWCSIQASC